MGYKRSKSFWRDSNLNAALEEACEEAGVELIAVSAPPSHWEGVSRCFTRTETVTPGKVMVAKHTHWDEDLSLISTKTILEMIKDPVRSHLENEMDCEDEGADRSTDLSSHPLESPLANLWEGAFSCVQYI